MRVFKQLFNFYINSSLHVGLACYALVQITLLLFQIPRQDTVGYFVFWGTIVGYNFVKYEELARFKKPQMRKQLRWIALFTLGSFIMVSYYFFLMERITQIIAIFFLVLTLLYTLPFFPNKKNARNWEGVKIYIVSFCWVGVTLVLPILDSGIAITSDFYLKCVQQFILIFVLILIFEIIDLRNDNPNLRTVPQQIGVKRTKNLGCVLLMIFCVLELFNSNFKCNKMYLGLMIIAVITVSFLAFANEHRSKYYTSFWVESIPILWWLLLINSFAFSK